MDRKVKSDLSNPIHYSISTLKRHNPEADVIVIDYSDGLADWEGIDAEIVPMKTKFDYVPGRCHLTISKIFDCHDIGQNYNDVFICDSDVFWMRPFIPEEHQDIEIHDLNAGCIFLRPSKSRAVDYMSEWMRVMRKTMEHDSERIRVLERYKRFTGHEKDVATEERCLFSMAQKVHDPGLSFNGIYSKLQNRPLPLKLSNFHAMNLSLGYPFPSIRGNCYKVVKEFSDSGNISLQEFVCLPEEIVISLLMKHQEPKML